MREYLRYLGACRTELDELEFEEKRYYIARMFAQFTQGSPQSEDIKPIFEVFKYVNSILYDKVLACTDLELVAQQISLTTDYLMD
jgi:hypothetical protein